MKLSETAKEWNSYQHKRKQRKRDRKLNLGDVLLGLELDGDDIEGYEDTMPENHKY